MDGIDADGSGASIGCRFAAFADGSLPRPGLLEVTPLTRVGNRFPEVVEMAHRDLRQALVFGLPEDQ